jgi:ribosomal protein S3AE
MGGLYLLLEEIGGESFAAYKEFGRQIVVAALANVRKTHTRIDVHMHTYTHTDVHTYTHTLVFLYIQIQMHTRIHIHACMYDHIHTHMHTLQETYLNTQLKSHTLLLTFRFMLYYRYKRLFVLMI